MSAPLVSVVCLCYNHARFVEESIHSVLNQTYSPVQLIVVDDKSSDESVEIINKVMAHHPVEFIPLPTNLGNCRAFNRGFAKAKGEFIIDLSADDVLLPDRIEKGVKIFQSRGNDVGVNFTDAQLINENGNVIGYHSDRFPHDSIPQGDIYQEILARYFINSPSMMMRREVLEKLGGYDESLAYEDFDFWIRSSRYYQYCYTPEPLIKRRIVGTSLGHGQFKKGSAQMKSTLAVCQKAFELNRNKVEHAALKRRVLYEMRRAVLVGEFNIAKDYLRLWWLIGNR